MSSTTCTETQAVSDLRPLLDRLRSRCDFYSRESAADGRGVKLPWAALNGDEQDGEVIAAMARLLFAELNGLTLAAAADIVVAVGDQRVLVESGDEFVVYRCENGEMNDSAPQNYFEVWEQGE